MEQNPTEALYSQLASKGMPALRKELKKKDDAMLFELLAHRSRDIHILNQIKIANAVSWELLSRLFAKNNLQKYFEGTKPLPKLSTQENTRKIQENTLKIQFLKFVGLYIEDPAPNEKQEKALFSIQELPNSSIAQFVFVGDGKLLILQNDYKTLTLFRKSPLSKLNTVELHGKPIKLHVQMQRGHYVSSFLIVQENKPARMIPLSLADDKIAPSKAEEPVDINANSLEIFILILFNDLNTEPKKTATDKLTLNNLLFLAYLYHFPDRATKKDSNILREPYVSYYNELPEEIRARLNLRLERSSVAVQKAPEISEEKEKEEASVTSAEDEATKKQKNIDLYKKAAQQAWWKQKLSSAWSLIKSPFVSIWTRISGWWK
jgi:hypothetical protein